MVTRRAAQDAIPIASATSNAVPTQRIASADSRSSGRRRKMGSRRCSDMPKEYPLEENNMHSKNVIFPLNNYHKNEINKYHKTEMMLNNLNQHFLNNNLNDTGLEIS